LAKLKLVRRIGLPADLFDHVLPHESSGDRVPGTRIPGTPYVTHDNNYVWCPQNFATSVEEDARRCQGGIIRI
jgi:hypothetical protein